MFGERQRAANINLGQCSDPLGQRDPLFRGGLGFLFNAFIKIWKLGEVNADTVC